MRVDARLMSFLHFDAAARYFPSFAQASATSAAIIAMAAAIICFSAAARAASLFDAIRQAEPVNSVLHFADAAAAFPRRCAQRCFSAGVRRFDFPRQLCASHAASEECARDADTMPFHTFISSIDARYADARRLPPLLLLTYLFHFSNTIIRTFHHAITPLALQTAYFRDIIDAAYTSPVSSVLHCLLRTAFLLSPGFEGYCCQR